MMRGSPCFQLTGAENGKRKEKNEESEGKGQRLDWKWERRKERETRQLTGDLVFLCNLKTVDDSKDLGELPSRRRWIRDHQADDSFGIEDEDGSNGVRQAGLQRLDHRIRGDARVEFEVEDSRDRGGEKRERLDQLSFEGRRSTRPTVRFPAQDSPHPCWPRPHPASSRV